MRHVSCYKQDRYGRQVCRLKTSAGKDAADIMLSEGLARYPETYVHEDQPVDREGYRRLHAEAHGAKRGLWSEPDPMSPKARRQRRQA
ncbi:thermonuclease family protein [Roseateles albus]|uniref:thermonuclease family protein n=1 Tax=Roseateles albus TaxID=2987525 RepID=UPI0039647856